MEKYEELELNIIVFEANDVITASPNADEGQDFPVT